MPPPPPAAVARQARPGSRWQGQLLGVVAWLVTPATLAAEQLDVSPPSSLVAGDPALLAESPGARGASLFRAALVFDYRRAPFVLVAPDQRAQRLVEHQLVAHALASFSIAHRYLLGLEVPVLLHQVGAAGPLATPLSPASGGVALGDPRLTLRGRLLGRGDGLALGFGVRASAPLATKDYVGNSAPSVFPFLSLGQQNDAVFSAVNLGVEWRKSQTLPGIVPTRIGAALRLAAASGFTLDSARSTRLGPELALVATFGNGARLLDPQSTVCQLLLHLQHRLRGGPFEVGAAAGPTLGRAPGAADYRVLLSLSFSPEEPAPPPDADDDRIADESDMCPSLPGEASEDPMMHGCPAVPSDADGDGIPDALDTCPRTPGPPSAIRQRHGCPKPPAPDPPKATLEVSQISISEQVQFETGTALIRDDSAAVLAQVAQVLQAHPEIESCEVAGHTDSAGNPELNRELSEARARAVMDWLTAHGVDARRLSARGYGQTRPSADNDSEAGRAQNRRVEFLIERRAAPAPAPAPSQEAP